jgi:hypothetical protein
MFPDMFLRRGYYQDRFLNFYKSWELIIGCVINTHSPIIVLIIFNLWKNYYSRVQIIYFDQGRMFYDKFWRCVFHYYFKPELFWNIFIENSGIDKINSNILFIIWVDLIFELRELGKWRKIIMMNSYRSELVNNRELEYFIISYLYLIYYFIFQQSWIIIDIEIKTVWSINSHIII